MVDGYIPAQYLRSERRNTNNSPFGSASEDFTKFETILLVGGTYQTREIWLMGSWHRSDALRFNPEVHLVSPLNALKHTPLKSLFNEWS